MCRDYGVPSLFYFGLYPQHVYLNQGRSAPLTCFQQYQADRLPCDSLGFQSFQQNVALRIVQLERHILTRGLVLDSHYCIGLVLEIVTYAQFAELYYLRIDTFFGDMLRVYAVAFGDEFSETATRE